LDSISRDRPLRLFDFTRHVDRDTEHPSPCPRPSSGPAMPAIVAR
jgi:hypothetical protein